MSNAFQFFQAAIDPLCVVTRGLVYEYNGTAYEYVTGIGLETFGLVYGQGEFWVNVDNPQDAGWTFVN